MWQRIRAQTICTSYVWQVSGNLSALRMIERLETDRDVWDGRRRWIATMKRLRCGRRREMLKLKFSQVIWTLSVARVVWIECHLLDLNEWAAARYKEGGLLGRERKRGVIMQTLSQEQRGHRMGEGPHRWKRARQRRKLKVRIQGSTIFSSLSYKSLFAAESL